MYIKTFLKNGANSAPHATTTTYSSLAFKFTTFVIRIELAESKIFCGVK